MIVDVALNLPIMQTFHYILPDALSDNACLIGRRVSVYVGKKKQIGFIVGILEKSDFTKLKEIIEIIDPDIVVDKKMMKLAKWISDYYISSLGEILFRIVPSNIKMPKKIPEIDSKDFVTHSSPFQLTFKQSEVVSELLKGLDTNEFLTYLLLGVTGSGKTEVYMRIMENIIKEDKAIIYLVPEISLTPQMHEIFKSRFKEHISIFHSRMTLREKKNEWFRIKTGISKIVIGPRSAVFAPVKNLGLIIVDEEHDPSYKQEDSPRYNARDVAIVRAKIENIKIILGSATPSLESFNNVINKKYKLLELDERVTGASMPDVSIVDMRYDLKGTYIFSRQLLNKMESCLAKKEQIILFLNKRGSASMEICKACGYISKCTRCDVSLTYHEKNNMLLCHYCAYKIKTNDACPKCSKALSYFGIGTQSVERQVKNMFKGTNIARFDTDSITQKGECFKILDDFKNQNIDILIGTQMLAKGLDFHNVTLIGIISSDIALNLPDFRAGERAYQLITQVAGRSGRGKKKGDVIIQSYNPDHFSITCSAYGKYKDYYKNEIKSRKLLGYPPDSKMIEIIFKGKIEKNVSNIAKNIYNIIEKEIIGINNIKILGPSPMPISYINKQYRWHILLKSKKYGLINNIAKNIYSSYKQKLGVRIYINVDPINMI